MEDSKVAFEIELDHLLKQYFGEEDLNRINFKMNPRKEEGNRISEMINDFYRNQLDIDIDSSNERIKIDRTITFSQNQLKPEKFSEFLLDLGVLCVSKGRLTLASEIFKKTKKSSTNILHQAEALLEQANILSRRGDWPRSLMTLAEAETLFKKIDESFGLAKCYNLLGSIYGDRGDIEKAKNYFLKSLVLINPETNLEMIANLNTNLGIIANIEENRTGAHRHLNDALVIYKKLDNSKRIAEVNYNIGLTFFDSKDYDSALDAFDEGIEIAKKERFLSILCLLYHSKSQVLIAKDDINSASEFVDKALEISHNVDDKLTFGDLYKLKGIIERQLKNYNLSESYLLNSLRINKSLKNEMNVAETSIELGILYDEIDNSKSKKSYLESALNYYKQINASQKVKEVETKLGIIVA